MTKSSAASKDDASEIDQLIDQATVIKGRLKDLQTELQDLITALRGQKKQAKLVRNTIDSLEKLKTLQV